MLRLIGKWYDHLKSILQASLSDSGNYTCTVPGKLLRIAFLSPDNFSPNCHRCILQDMSLPLSALRSLTVGISSLEKKFSSSGIYLDMYQILIVQHNSWYVDIVSYGIWFHFRRKPSRNGSKQLNQGFLQSLLLLNFPAPPPSAAPTPPHPDAKLLQNLVGLRFSSFRCDSEKTQPWLPLDACFHCIYSLCAQHCDVSTILHNIDATCGSILDTSAPI